MEGVEVGGPSWVPSLHSALSFTGNVCPEEKAVSVAAPECYLHYLLKFLPTGSESLHTHMMPVSHPDTSLKFPTLQLG